MKVQVWAIYIYSVTNNSVLCWKCYTSPRPSFPSLRVLNSLWMPFFSGVASSLQIFSTLDICEELGIERWASPPRSLKRYRFNDDLRVPSRRSLNPSGTWKSGLKSGSVNQALQVGTLNGNWVEDKLKQWKLTVHQAWKFSSWSLHCTFSMMESLRKQGDLCFYLTPRTTQASQIWHADGVPADGVFGSVHSGISDPSRVSWGDRRSVTRCVGVIKPFPWDGEGDRGTRKQERYQLTAVVSAPSRNLSHRFWVSSGFLRLHTRLQGVCSAAKWDCDGVPLCLRRSFEDGAAVFTNETSM